MSAPSTDPDSRYARGEISRDEWQRLRTTAPSTPPPPAPPSRRPFLLLAVVLVAAVAIAAGVMWTLGGSPGVGWNPSLGGVKMMQASDLATLNASATAGTAYAGNDTLWFRGASVTMAVYMSPPDHDMAFVIQGIANPTIHVAAGTRVTLTIVNMDTDYHNWALTKTAPPYSSMPMMSGGTMMTMTMLGPMSSAGYPSESMSFTAQSGSYWYLCQFASHAADGMYGGFVVA